MVLDSTLSKTLKASLISSSLSVSFIFLAIMEPVIIRTHTAVVWIRSTDFVQLQGQVGMDEEERQVALKERQEGSVVFNLGFVEWQEFAGLVSHNKPKPQPAGLLRNRRLTFA
ncbi:hypothetical protein CRUP_024621 [Coryphaenoides rupestris]|nr:hypothetical protein CRUP_024621 [Coryphaenoides rupestris]